MGLKHPSLERRHRAAERAWAWSQACLGAGTGPAAGLEWLWQVFLSLTLCFLIWKTGPAVWRLRVQTQEDVDWSLSSVWVSNFTSLNVCEKGRAGVKWPGPQMGSRPSFPFFGVRLTPNPGSAIAEPSDTGLVLPPFSACFPIWKVRLITAPTSQGHRATVG